MNNKKKNEGQTDFSYYGLYLLDYLRTNRFEQASDDASSGSVPTVPPKRMSVCGSKAIRPKGRRSWRWTRSCGGFAIPSTPSSAKSWKTSLPTKCRKETRSFIRKLLPPVGNVFSAYDLSDDNFALSPEYDLLYTELTGAAVLYIDEYGV